MARPGTSLIAALALSCACACGLADDVVGVLRVGSDTNGEATVEMPFTPFGDGTISTFLSGTFVGDGGVDSDRLWRISLADGAFTNAVFASGEWIDPADGLASTLTAACGDTLVLASGDMTPFDFWLHGRVVPRAGWPFISGFSVAPDGTFADIAVATGGYPADIFAVDADVPGAAWRYIGRRPGYPHSFAWRDTSLGGMSDGLARFYLVSDASRDTDGDGVPDSLERNVYGTSPFLCDTDGDGVVDGLEIAWGGNPLVPDQPAQFTFFEPFEPPSVQLGSIDGQNGWRANSADEAVVQGEFVHAGAGALRMETAQDVSSASRVVDCDAEVVWADLYQTASRGGDESLSASDAFASYAFDGDGHPVMTDGAAVVTNLDVAVMSPTRWVRCTCRFDFPNRRWDFYLDGIIVANGLAMRGTANAFHEFVTAGVGHLDDLKISTERPDGLSSDGDALPDEWEFRHFGTLDRDGMGDADGDGMGDLDECRVGTDPLVPSWDTDGDGLPDWWEVANGLDPLSPGRKGTAVFSELFERPSVVPGELSGQNGWRVNRLGTALVQNAVVHAGDGALFVRGGSFAEGDDVEVSRPVAFGDDVFWSDIRIRSSIGGANESIATSDAFAAYAFDDGGHPVMIDGCALATNSRIRVAQEDGWTRCTCRFDFVGRRWDFYVDGVIAGKNLAMRGAARGLSEILLTGGAGFVDDWNLTVERPEGLSSDNDIMHDEWEFLHFGTLDRDGTGDADGDGLLDADEFRIGADPGVVDTDGDGMSDGWEAVNGLDPLDPADATADPDGDGVPNADEYAFGGDPHLPEPDPRTRLPGLRAEFWRTTGKQATMPDFVALFPSTLGTVPCVDMPSAPWRDGAAIGNYFACHLEGFIRIPADGGYTFYLSSNAGVVMTIDGETVVSDPSAHSTRTRNASRNLDRGFHPIAIDFYKNTGDESLVLEWEGPGQEREIVSAEAFCNMPVAETLPTGYDSGLISSGMETSGALRAPLSGNYRLTVSSSRGFRLWLDGRLLVDCLSTWRSVSRTITLPLAAGLHDIRVEHASSGAGFALSWSCDGTPSEAVPERFLFHAVSSEAVDGDGDGMPDWWEELHGFDPDDPSDAALDPDGDGLSNLAEFHAGTDPRRPDTDGDGMPDAWEVVHGTCPFLHDALSDPDGDGLANIEEYAVGTDVLNADTDGDGCPDGQEVRNVRSNPLVADIAWQAPVDVGDAIAGAAAVASTGTWRTETDGTIYAAERAGSLEWRLAVPTGGVDALAIRVGQHEFYSKTSKFDIALKVDGLFVGRLTVSAPYGTTADACFFLPEIPPGDHDFVLVWHNWEANTFLSVRDLRFVRFGGPDVDGNGDVDWRDSRNSTASAIDAPPCESLVSPLCVEGHDLWRDVLEVEVAYPGTNAAFSVVKTIGDGFYVDIPLVEEGTSLITLADRSLAHSYPVVWSAFDVFSGDYATNALAIRSGDSLRIAGYGDSSSTVTVSRATAAGEWMVVTNWTQTASTPYRFDVPGAHLVSVSADGWFGPHVAHALVDVVSSRFPKRNPAVQMDRVQVLECPSLSPRNLVEHDHELDVSATVSGDGVSLELLTHANRDLGLVSRIDEDGPISDAVQVTPVWFDNGTYYHVAQTYPDGSQLVEVSFLFGGLPDGMTVKLEIFVSGVTFEDGTRTKILTADDMDENGHCTVRFVRARGVTTSVCHRTYLYQDGQLIYTNK